MIFAHVRFYFNFTIESGKIREWSRSKLRKPNATLFNTLILLFIPSVNPLEYAWFNPSKISAFQSLNVFITLLNSSTSLPLTNANQRDKNEATEDRFFIENTLKMPLLRHRISVILETASKSSEGWQVLFLSDGHLFYSRYAYSS